MPIRHLPHTRFARANRKGGGGGLPPIVVDGNTVKYFDYLTGTTIVTGVSDWANVPDIPGIIPGSLIQQATTKQPALTDEGILFDGNDNNLKTAAFTLVQPEYMYIVFRQVTWTAGDYIFDGNGANSGIIYQNTTTPGIRAFAGTLSTQNSNLPLNTFGIARVLLNGAGSKFIIDETTPVTGNFGASNMGGFTLGSIGNAGSGFSNIEVKGAMIRKVADSDANSLIIKNYLKDKYSI